MALWLSWPLRWLLKPFTSDCAPQQIALALALGMLVGLVPKGNLIAVVLGVAMLAAQVNLGTAALSVCCFSWIGWLLDPLTHRLGAMLLFSDSLTGLWTWLYRLPLGPWLALNNTVVLGSLALGLVLVYPAYRITKRIAAEQLPKLADRLRSHAAARAIFELQPATEGGEA